MKKKIAVIGSGFAGMSAASFLAKGGCEVTIYEKNETIGGRARKFSADGFTFDMGPSWYWMPDVFESYFERLGYKVEDFYKLERLDPSYQVFFEDKLGVDIPASMDEIHQLFESIEEGSSSRLKQFLEEAAYKYEVGINDLVYKPGRSLTEFLDARLAIGVFKLHVFQSISKYIRKYFTHPKLIQLLEFPVLFLGAKPQDTPALYSLMNYADISLGTWYPQGGMNKIVEGMGKVAKEHGVTIKTSTNVQKIEVANGSVKGIIINGKLLEYDYVVGGADYHHVEQQLLEPKYRMYDEKYWDSRAMAPSSLIYYLGVNKTLEKLRHHNLFFDESFDTHAEEIYDAPQWPSKPLFYVCCPSKTDDTVAPAGMENVFILIPVAPDLKDTEEERQKYFNMVMERMERLTGQSIREHVVYQRSYAHKDFISDYNSFKGNAYGLANTLKQTAILKPSIVNKKVKRLYYTGQLTVPGPGVPPSLISGQVTAKEILKSIG
ncbi:MAG: phytoene desaturase family protein [Fulvivirga sp.]|uniref:phytoene desaturase family protein n=1 Tax=Fulvivirga sp. TaxID=1931237 RepID=UPI0032EA9B0D